MIRNLHTSIASCNEKVSLTVINEISSLLEGLSIIKVNEDFKSFEESIDNFLKSSADLLCWEAETIPSPSVERFSFTDCWTRWKKIIGGAKVRRLRAKCLHVFCRMGLII